MMNDNFPRNLFCINKKYAYLHDIVIPPPYFNSETDVRNTLHVNIEHLALNMKMVRRKP